MIDDISRIEADTLPRIEATSSVAELRALEAEVLGKKGSLSQLKSGLGKLDADDRKVVGAAMHRTQTSIDVAIAARRATLEAGERAERLAAERLDLTEVRRPRGSGTCTSSPRPGERLEDVFVGMGFTVAEGPEVETDWHNFEALNFPAGHPARAM